MVTAKSRSVKAEPAFFEAEKRGKKESLIH